MYYAMIALLMVILPIGSVLVEWLTTNIPLIFLIGKWFTFWTVGIRLLVAGIKQFTSPSFTAETIFETKDEGAKKIVTELGVGNMAIGLIGTASLYFPTWIMPAAVAGAIFYGLAGIKHVFNKGKNTIEMTATVTDLWAALVLIVYIAAAGLGTG